MNTAQAIGSGVAGAVVLTALHESLKHITPEAPHMDQIGMQVVKKAKSTVGKNDLDKENLYDQALASDLVANTLLYSLIGAGEKPSLWRGLLIGAGVGTAAVLLPKLLPVDEEAAGRTNKTAAMNIGIYALAGLAAAGMKALFQYGKTH